MNSILVTLQINAIFWFSDDENDVSDDSDTEDPHVVSMDRNHTRAQSERQKNRDRFLELEQGLRWLIMNVKWKSFSSRVLGSDNDEDDEEFRRFEHEQIRKGVSSKISAMSSINKLASSSSKSQVGAIRRKIFSYALFSLSFQYKSRIFSEKNHLPTDEDIEDCFSIQLCYEN